MLKIFNEISSGRKGDLQESLKDKNSQIDFYNAIEFASLKNREIYVNNLTPSTIDNIERTIRYWNQLDDEDIDECTKRSRIIKIYFNCYGGSLDSALTLVDVIKNSRTQVYTINTGACQKEAIYPYLAGIRRYAYPRSSFYIETDNKSYDITEGQSNYEDFIKKQNLELKSMVLEITKITENDYDNRKGWWLSAEKANELKVCNEVLRGKFI